jgi:hypothetical protein
MNGNNTHDDTAQIRKEELNEFESEDPNHIRRDKFTERMEEASKLSYIGRFSGKMQAKTLADVISKTVHYHTVTEGEYNADERVLVLGNYAADAVKPAHVIEAMNVPNWRGVESVGQKDGEIFIFFW